MTTETQSADEELLAKFNAHDSVDVEDVPDPIMRVMRYIEGNTGLLGNYNDGLVQLTEGGRTIQWYARNRMFSGNNNLLTWLQQSDNQDVCLGQVGTRSHPETDETSGYIEIMESERWGIE